MKIINKLQKASQAQKLIFTLWIVLSFLWGRSWAIADYDEAMIIFYIPIALVVLAIPAFVLYKVWDKNSPAKTASKQESSRGSNAGFCSFCGKKLIPGGKFCKHCGSECI